MGVVEVEVISKEMVKPSSPTPQHLRRYQFSFLDQLNMVMHSPMVYFYHADDVATKFNTKEASNHLKNSLSLALTHFYPLAGRLKPDELLVDCSDAGVPYTETRVRCHLSHFTSDNLSLADVNKLLPYDMDEAVDTILGVQFNVFECGGIAVGVCLSHKVGDALSYFQFIKSWAAVARGGGELDLIRTHFQSSSFFPPKNIKGYNPESCIAKEKLVAKRFVFEESVIKSLRRRFSKMNQKPPSRFEVLSTFLLNRLIGATEEKVGNKKHLVTFTTNIRPRMDPPLPEFAFGNYYVETLAAVNQKGEFDDLGKHLREIDNDFIKMVREHEGFGTIPNLEEIKRAVEKGEAMRFHLTSICSFPVNEVDFGWGNPTWVGVPIWKFKNLIIFKDAQSRGGIEVYVNLTEEDLAKFEHDKELLALVSTKSSK